MDSRDKLQFARSQISRAGSGEPFRMGQRRQLGCYRHRGWGSVLRILEWRLGQSGAAFCPVPECADADQQHQCWTHGREGWRPVHRGADAFLNCQHQRSHPRRVRFRLRWRHRNARVWSYSAKRNRWPHWHHLYLGLPGQQRRQHWAAYFWQQCQCRSEGLAGSLRQQRYRPPAADVQCNRSQPCHGESRAQYRLHSG